MESGERGRGGERGKEGEEVSETFRDTVPNAGDKEKARKALGEFDAPVKALPRGKTTEASCEETLGRRDVLVKTGKNGW